MDQGYHDVGVCSKHIHIVTCQRGGISNKPPGLQAGRGARDPLKRRTDRTLVLRQGEPGMSQYIHGIFL